MAGAGRAGRALVAGVVMAFLSDPFYFPMQKGNGL